MKKSDQEIDKQIDDIRKRHALHHELAKDKANLWLAYYELHVGSTTFIVHALVHAKTFQGACDKFFKQPTREVPGSKSATLQPKGVLGAADACGHYLFEPGGGIGSTAKL